MSAHTELLSDPLPPEPLRLAAEWLAQAWRERHQPHSPFQPWQPPTILPETNPWKYRRPSDIWCHNAVA